MFVVIGHSFSLFTTLSDTDTERQALLLVSHRRAYSPESASERGGSAISRLPFLVKVNQHVCEKDTQIKAKRCSFHRDSDVPLGDGLPSSDPGACKVARKLLQGNVEFLPRTHFHLDWSRWAQIISWNKTLYLKNICPFHLEVSEKNNMSNCYCYRRGFFFNLLIACAELARHCSSSRAGTQEENS